MGRDGHAPARSTRKGEATWSGHGREGPPRGRCAGSIHTEGGGHMKRSGQRVTTWGTIIGFAAMLSGCASAERPNVYAYPQKGQTAEQQSRDQAGCQAWAK